MVTSYEGFLLCALKILLLFLSIVYYCGQSKSIFIVAVIVQQRGQFFMIFIIVVLVVMASLPMFLLPEFVTVKSCNGMFVCCILTIWPMNFNYLFVIIWSIVSELKNNFLSLHLFYLFINYLSFVDFHYLSNTLGAETFYFSSTIFVPIPLYHTLTDF